MTDLTDLTKKSISSLTLFSLILNNQTPHPLSLFLMLLETEMEREAGTETGTVAQR